MDLMAPNFGASVWVFIWDSFPTEIVAWQQPSFSLCCPSFHITRLIRHASLIRHIIFHPWHLPMSQIMTNPPKKLPFPLAHRIIRAMFDFTLILHLTLKSGFLKIWQPRRTMKSSQHVSKTLWFQRKFPQWNPPSCKYWWIIQGSPPSQPGGGKLLLGDGTQFISTCLANITSWTVCVDRCVEAHGFLLVFLPRNEENISHRNGKSSTQKCWLVGDMLVARRVLSFAFCKSFDCFGVGWPWMRRWKTIFGFLGFLARSGWNNTTDQIDHTVGQLLKMIRGVST